MKNDLFHHLPKAELHVHLEGCLEPAQIIEFANRNKISFPFQSADEVRAGNKFDDLAQFVAVMSRNSATIRTERDVYEIAYEYLRRASEDNIVHAEMAFSPQGPAQRGVPYEAVFEGIIAAFGDAKRDFGITGGPILACLRHRPAEEAYEMLITYGHIYRDNILSIGLHGAENGFPPEPFKECFELGRSYGWKAVAHAGEEGPAEYVWQAIDILKVDRIDHGVGCAADPALVRRLREDKTPLTVCPLSNIHLGVFPTIKDHNFRMLLKQGLKVSLHTDDPSYFDGYLSNHYRILSNEGEMNLETLKAVQRNAFASAFIDPARQVALTDMSDQIIAAEADVTLRNTKH